MSLISGTKCLQASTQHIHFMRRSSQWLNSVHTCMQTIHCCLSLRLLVEFMIRVGRVGLNHWNRLISQHHQRFASTDSSNNSTWLPPDWRGYHTIKAGHGSKLCSCRRHVCVIGTIQDLFYDDMCTFKKMIFTSFFSILKNFSAICSVPNTGCALAPKIISYCPLVAQRIDDSVWNHSLKLSN